MTEIIVRCDERFINYVPAPVPARRALPDWLKRMHNMSTHDPGTGALPTFKNCQPMVDAFKCGFMMPLICDIEITDKGWRWDWPPEEFPDLRPVFKRPVSSHHPAQAQGSPITPGDNKSFIKWTNVWQIETPPGWNLMVTHPHNRNDLPFETLTGVVDCHAYKNGYVHFPAIWRDYEFRGVLKAGTPVAQVTLVPADQVELSIRTMTSNEEILASELSNRMRVETGVYKALKRDSRSL